MKASCERGGVRRACASLLETCLTSTNSLKRSDGNHLVAGRAAMPHTAFRPHRRKKRREGIQFTGHTLHESGQGCNERLPCSFSVCHSLCRTPAVQCRPYRSPLVTKSSGCGQDLCPLTVYSRREE